MANYYINGTTLATSSTVFTDSKMTIAAANGFYSDGSGISRQQLSGILQTAQTCPTCATSCGEAVSTVGNEGVYLLNIDAGNSASDVGAIVVRLPQLAYLMG